MLDNLFKKIVLIIITLVVVFIAFYIVELYTGEKGIATKMVEIFYTVFKEFVF